MNKTQFFNLVSVVFVALSVIMVVVVVALLIAPR